MTNLKNCLEFLQQLDIARIGRHLNQMRLYWSISAKHIQAVIRKDSLAPYNCPKRRTFSFAFVRSWGRSHEREDIFKLGASIAASEFREWVKVGIDVYIPHHEHQVKLYTSPWFLAACAGAIAHRNQFFICIKRINPLNLK